MGLGDIKQRGQSGTCAFKTVEQLCHHKVFCVLQSNENCLLSKSRHSSSCASASLLVVCRWPSHAVTSFCKCKATFQTNEARFSARRRYREMRPLQSSQLFSEGAWLLEREGRPPKGSLFRVPHGMQLNQFKGDLLFRCILSYKEPFF